MRLVGAAAALAAAPQLAQAHAFTSGADLYAQFVEGVEVPLFDPRQALALIAVGLMLTLADPDGLPRAWLGLICGMLAGILVAPLVPPSVVLVTLAMALVCGAIAALSPPLPFRATAAIAAATVASVTALAFEGHALLELPALIRLGVLFGANLVLSVPAGLAALALRNLPPAPARIGLRIAASWCTAIAAMLLAFQFR